MKFFYDTFDNPIVQNLLRNYEIPNYISDNLKFKTRPYQDEAFRRYLFTEKDDFDGKPEKPLHLLFNMATGSGKTLVMAGLILHLYKQGYRNFLFFVNSNNIIQKTKDNFLNAEASKYLFSDKITIDGKEILIKEILNFDEADRENINIKFTTIQQLHLDLNETKENSITYEDLQNKEIVLIADEAHHLSAATKSGKLFGSWENTVMEILKQNYNNILLEFTATIDYGSREIVEKYRNKVIYKYDLSEFRIDKYSKEINLIRSDYEEKDRIIQALILNLYRQELATSNYINLKPVILFKAKRTIKESEQNKENFHQLIEAFSVNQLEKIRNTSTIPIIQKAFQFFENNSISLSEIVTRIQYNFKEENCLSANNDAEAEQNQILLNTLEDKNNPIRAIFAVQKLNEGWDVLNLFDIVRLYEGRDSKSGKPGKTTIAEAQLIGRGARYFPFALSLEQDKYKRKYDKDLDNDLRILEELFYHTKEDSRYISELKKVLVETGIYEDEDNLEEKQLTLKWDYKNSDHYRQEFVFLNKKIERDYSEITSFEDMNVKRKNYQHILASGFGRAGSAFFEMENPTSNDELKKLKDIPLSKIPKHIIFYALSNFPFFHFNNLIRYFPNIKSHSEFIQNKEYLAGLSITFKGTRKRLISLSNEDFLQALLGLLQKIEIDIQNNATEYEGSEFFKKPIREVFTDTTIRVKKYSTQSDGQQDLVAHEPWYVYNANYGTTEEKHFVELFSMRFEHLNQKFTNVFLIRNERKLAIYNRSGQRFEPDFLLFCTRKTDGNLTYQVFIEPKGKHLKGYDQWKEDFLIELRNNQQTIHIHTDAYLITGVPFYNYDDDNQFAKELEETLKTV